MANGKLTFRYGAMNSGKSREISSMIYNYKEQNRKAIVLISDTMDRDYIQPRGAERIDAFRFKELINNNLNLSDCQAIIVDEAQFLNKEEVLKLNQITLENNIDVIAYGLRTDFKGEPFEGSIYLLSLADSLEELTTLCVECKDSRKARMNGRRVNGVKTKTGDSILIDGTDTKVEYTSLCRKCFYK